MNSIERARRFDQSGDPVKAIGCYEDAVIEGQANLDAYLDLVLLYLNCTDFGYASVHKIPADIEKKSYDRAFEVLDAAERKFGRHSEIAFWKAYLPFKALGEMLSSEFVERIVNKKESLVPYFFLYISSGGKSFLTEAKDLVKEVSVGHTTRQRYVLSFLKPLFN